MFDVRVESGGQVVVSGRFDAAESIRTLHVFQGLNSSTTVDCSELEYISSAGIAVMMETYKRLTGGGHQLRLVRVPPRVRTIFEYAGLAELFGIS